MAYAISMKFIKCAFLAVRMVIRLPSAIRHGLVVSCVFIERIQTGFFFMYAKMSELLAVGYGGRFNKMWRALSVLNAEGRCCRLQ